MNIPMVATDLAKWIAFGQCRVKAIHGWNNQASDVYIQLHEVSQGVVAAATVPPVNATVPKYKSLLAQAGNGFFYGPGDFGENGVDFSELVICCSTTEVNLTLVGAAGGLDMTVEVDGPYLVVNYPTLTVVGDLTNSVNTLQVWAEASGPNTLMRVDGKKVSSQAAYIAVYAVDTPAATSKVQAAFALSDSSTVVSRNCGQGFKAAMIEQTSGFVNHQGCTIQPQDVATAEANPGLNAKIRAMYI